MVAGIGFIVGLLLLAAFASVIGLIEARRKKRNALGWLVSIVASIVGAIGGAMAAGTVIGASRALKDAGPDGIVSVLMVGGIVIGSCLALWLVNRFRN